MSLHDAYARITPYELAFPEPDAVDRLIADIAEEARGRGADPAQPHEFITMGAVGAFIRDLQGSDAPPEAIHQYGALVFHAVHFREAGCPVYVLGAHAARYLVGGAPSGATVPPKPSGYLQLPQHLFWTAGAEGSPPESIDGLFWTLSSTGMLHILLATGLRPDRPGFGTVPVPEAPVSDASSWMGIEVRAAGGDFSSTMPGGELDGLCTVESSGEILKLLARFFAYVTAVPSALVRCEPATGTDGGPTASLFSHDRVVLDG